MTANRDFKELVRSAMAGRWLDLFESSGISRDVLNGKNHACPKCGGSDRFRVLDADKGALYCNHCLTKKNDGFGSLLWALDLATRDFGKVVTIAAEFAGVAKPSEPAKEKQRETIVADFCKLKEINVESLLRFDAKVSSYGKSETVAIEIPLHGNDGKPKSAQFFSPYGGKMLSKGITAKGKGSGLFLPDGRKPMQGETVLIVEGVKDASKLLAMGYYVIGVPGGMSLKAYVDWFEGCDVVSVPDSDRAGMNNSLNQARLLIGTAASFKVARLADEIAESKGVDVRDVYKSKGEEFVRSCIENAEEINLETLNANPVIYLEPTTSFKSIVDAIIEIMAERGWTFGKAWERIYQNQNGELVILVRIDGRLKQVVLGESGLLERIDHAITFVVPSTNDDFPDKTVKLPSKYLAMIFERADYGPIRRLKAITETPTMLPDGSLVQTPGYNQRARLYFEPNADFPIVPESPTQDDARAAAAKLLDLVTDFPFSSPAAKTVWLAGLLTMVARHAIDGCTPAFVVDSNAPGSGKSLLVDLNTIIAYGDEAPRTTLASRDEELRKQVTALLLEQTPVLLIDNVGERAKLGNAVLDALVTSKTWKDRILGVSKSTGELPNQMIIWATGNAIRFGGDMVRRTMLCRLETELENPENRTGFKYPAIKKHVKENRPKLVVACLTLLRAFVVAGYPMQPGKGSLSTGSFEEWSRLIVGAIRWCGLADPTATAIEVKAAHESSNELKLLIHSLSLIGSCTSAELLAGIQNSDSGSDWDSIKAVFGDIPPAKLTTKRVGCKIRAYQKRVCDGQRINSKVGGGNVKSWFVEAVGSIETAPGITVNLGPEPEAPHGFCEDSECGEVLTGTETHDGYLNVECQVCDRVYRTEKLEQRG